MPSVVSELISGRFGTAIGKKISTIWTPTIGKKTVPMPSVVLEHLSLENVNLDVEHQFQSLNEQTPEKLVTMDCGFSEDSSLDDVELN